MYITSNFTVLAYGHAKANRSNCLLKIQVVTDVCHSIVVPRSLFKLLGSTAHVCRRGSHHASGVADVAVNMSLAAHKMVISPDILSTGYDQANVDVNTVSRHRLWSESLQV